MKARVSVFEVCLLHVKQPTFARRHKKTYLHKTRGLFRLDDGRTLIEVYLQDGLDEPTTIVPIESAFDRAAARLSCTVKPWSIKVLRMGCGRLNGALQ